MNQLAAEFVQTNSDWIAAIHFYYDGLNQVEMIAIKGKQGQFASYFLDMPPEDLLARVLEPTLKEFKCL